MKTNAILRIVIYSLIIVLLLGILAAGIGVGTFILNIHTDSGEHITGAGSVPASEIDTIQIEWAAGSIYIQTADTDTITFSEEGNASENQRMVYSHNNGKLRIQHQESTVQLGFVSTSAKDLTITVPEDWKCSKLDIDSASTDARLENLVIDAVDLDSASNAFDFRNCQIGTLSVDGASNSIDLDGTLNKLDCDGMSATLTLVLTNVPVAIDLDGMSSDLDLTLPADCGFRVTMDGLSNDFSSDFSAVSTGGSYTYGDESCRIDVDGMSSKVTIRKGE